MHTRDVVTASALFLRLAKLDAINVGIESQQLVLRCLLAMARLGILRGNGH
jgi:hypothetical protein